MRRSFSEIYLAASPSPLRPAQCYSTTSPFPAIVHNFVFFKALVFFPRLIWISENSCQGSHGQTLRLLFLKYFNNTKLARNQFYTTGVLRKQNITGSSHDNRLCPGRKNRASSIYSLLQIISGQEEGTRYRQTQPSKSDTSTRHSK